MPRSTDPATVQVATGQATRNVARHAGHAHPGSSTLTPHVDGAFWLAHPAEGDAHGRPLRSLLKRGLSTQELKLAYMAIEPALAKDIDETEFVRRLEGKSEPTATPAVKPTGYWTIAEYTKITKRSRSAVYLDMEAGRLPFIAVGRRARRIPMSVLEKLENEAFAAKTATIEETVNAESMPPVTRTNEQAAADQQCVSLPPPPVQRPTIHHPETPTGVLETCFQHAFADSEVAMSI